ncbi:MAG: MASE1 domain-containing protein [Methanoregula sp.]|nr:MASE1 domain-containing protein [Methanoregula sp.]
MPAITGHLQANVTSRQHPPFPIYIGLFFLLLCINALFAKFAVFTFEVGPGISSFYIVVALMIVFGLWFGMWGAIAAYAGCFVGAGLLSGIPAGINLFWSLADFWQVLIPLLAFRYLRADPALGKWRDLIIVLLFGVFINNVCGALWGSLTLALAGVIPWSGVGTALLSWLLGNIIVCLVLLPLILYIFTPLVRSHELFVNSYWN